MDSNVECQRRMHVAVDRITGGAAEGVLFENRVLTFSDEQAVEFEFRVVINNPLEHEAKWLGQTLIALDMGVLRVGCSKSSGRLELVPKSMKISGEHWKLVEQLLAVTN